MMQSTVKLQVLIGPTMAVPAPGSFMQNLHQVEVRLSDSADSGFSMTLQIGRQSALGIPMYDLELDPLARRGNRVILCAIVQGVPSVLVDGIVTEVELSPSQQAGASTLTLRGRDLTVLMDLADPDRQYPAQSDDVVVRTILADYAQYGVVQLDVHTPPAAETPRPNDRVPSQRSSDLQHVRSLARRHGFVFFLEPSGIPGMNRAYWGPPPRTGRAQHALAVNMGPFTTVTSFQGSQAEHATELVDGYAQDRDTGERVPVQSTEVSTRAPLAAIPASTDAPNLVRRVKFDGAGLTAAQALARAQAHSDRVSDRAVRASGTTDGVRYGGVLRPRQLVDVRGAGFSYDGTWYVEQVTLDFTRGTFTQQFQLAREGTGPLSPTVAG